ncbi:5-carboxymethyl-2-hydroxymuconate Delta-isomerase [Phaeobacter sp. HF9A]|uniref:5-carboxymethyl-2-hydroxymuconate Delta-isomerase n=1 Tax=Phaeobacter sp. HF9A TaxID=2721561 RepID=UPI00143170E7|nr:5-carboxymethyl-2-hydroxymuconate Delta-isomerase [Phaeobacter sp. HF9A]NIZ12551.1 5-carboxymethyl-2-hydroxymuconate isomerase [Phaeobacter sp. HF9A]
MPHLSIDYSPSLDSRVDVAAFCRIMHAALVASPDFPTAGIRVRAHRADHAIVADGDAKTDFLAMTLSVGAGRDHAQLKDAGNALFAAAQSFLEEPLSTPYFALSLEIRVLDPELSWKDTPIHARLSGHK